MERRKLKGLKGTGTNHREHLGTKSSANGSKRNTERRREGIRGLTDIIKALGWFRPTLRYSSLNDIWSSLRRGRWKSRRKTRTRTLRAMSPSRTACSVVPEKIESSENVDRELHNRVTGQCNYDIFTVSWQETHDCARPLEVNDWLTSLRKDPRIPLTW